MTTAPNCLCKKAPPHDTDEHKQFQTTPPVPQCGCGTSLPASHITSQHTAVATTVPIHTCTCGVMPSHTDMQHADIASVPPVYPAPAFPQLTPDFLSACVIGPGQLAPWGAWPLAGVLSVDRIWDAGMDYCFTQNPTNPFAAFAPVLDSWIAQLRKTHSTSSGAAYKCKGIVTLCWRGAFAKASTSGVWTSSFLQTWQNFITQLCDTYGKGKLKDATDVIEGFEIWNEPDAGPPNNDITKGTGLPSGNTVQCVENWLALAAIAAPPLRGVGYATSGACPQSGAHDTTGWLYIMGTKYGGQHLDAITRHHYRAAPEDIAHYLAAEIALLQQFPTIAGKPWYVTEFNSNAWSAPLNEDQAIAFMQRAYILSFALGRVQGKQILRRMFAWNYDSHTGMPTLFTCNAGNAKYPSTPNGGETAVAKSWGLGPGGKTASGKVYQCLQSKLVGTQIGGAVGPDSLGNYSVSLVYPNGTPGTAKWNASDLSNAAAIPQWT